MNILIITMHPRRTQTLQNLIRELHVHPTVITPDEINKAWLTQYQLIYIHPSIIDLEHENTIKKIRNLNWYIPLLLSHMPEQETQNTFLAPRNIHIEALAQTMHDLIRRFRKKALKKLKYQDLTLDPSKRVVKRKKKEFHLRNKEFGILELMMKNPEQTITKTELTETLWDRNATLLSNTLQVHISGLRQKIDKGFTKKLIHTIPCIGYRLGE